MAGNQVGIQVWIMLYVSQLACKSAPPALGWSPRSKKACPGPPFIPPETKTVLNALCTTWLLPQSGKSSVVEILLMPAKCMDANSAGGTMMHHGGASYAQVLYALRVLRAHGLCDSALHTIYRSVVVAKLLYASSAWESFADATDRNKIQSFINKSRRNDTFHPIYLFSTICAPQ